MDPKSRKRSIPPAIWVFLAAFAVRIIAFSWFFSSPFFLPDNGDMKFYNGWALKILHGQWTDHQAFYGLPGYPFFLAAIYTLVGKFFTFKGAVATVGVLQVVAESFTTMLIYLIAQEIFVPLPGDQPAEGRTPKAPIIGALAAMGWILFQPAQTFSMIVMPTSWMVLAFWWVVWFVLKMRNPGVWNPWLWLGLLIGVVTMMVATILFLVPLLVLAIFIKLEPGRELRARLPKMAAACALLIAGVAAGASPCALHNYLIAHEPVFLSAHSGLNFYIGNNEIANGYTKIPPGLRAGQEGMLQDSILWAEKAEGRKLKRVEVSHYWSAKADDFIHHHFGDWLKLMCLKFKNFWNAYQYDDLSLVTMFASEGIITPGLKFGFVAALGIPGLLVAFAKYRRSRWVVAAVLLHMASLMTVFITERYRMAAAPGLLILAAIGLWEFWEWLARGRWAQAAGYAAGCAAAAFFVSLPVTDGAGLWSLDYYNTGFKATENGDLDAARKNLDTAFEYVPENSEINFALGNLWLKMGDAAVAKTFYLAAARMNARHSGAFNNLGYLALQDKQWKDAAGWLERAIAIEPDDAKTYYLLAKARAGAGDYTAADTAIKQALVLSPDDKDFQQLAGEINKNLHKP